MSDTNKAEFKRVQLDKGAANGAIVGAAIGAALGLAYGHFPKITSLALGPVPSELVGLLAGAVGGGFLGAFAGTVGKKLLTLRAAAGFAIALAVIILGRLADDTGKIDADGKPLYDWLWDIIASGAVYGVIGAIIGAVLFGEQPGEAQSPEACAAPPAKDAHPS